MTGEKITLIGKLLLLTEEDISQDLKLCLFQEAELIIRESETQIETAMTEQAKDMGKTYVQPWEEGFDFGK